MNFFRSERLAQTGAGLSIGRISSSTRFVSASGLGNPVNGAGQIDTTTARSRQMQLGLKIIW